MASVTETLESMATLVQDLSGQLAAIATATEQQSRAAQEVAGTVEEIAGLSHQSSEHGQQGEQIAARPTRETGRLTSAISRFPNWMPDARGRKMGQTSGSAPFFFGPITWWWKDARRRCGPDRSEAGDGVLCTALWLFLPTDGFLQAAEGLVSKLLQVSWLSRLTSRMARFSPSGSR